MNVYSVEVYSNGWMYNSVSGDVDCATSDWMNAVEKFGDTEEWEMNISMVNVL